MSEPTKDGVAASGHRSDTKRSGVERIIPAIFLGTLRAAWDAIHPKETSR